MRSITFFLACGALLAGAIGATSCTASSPKASAVAGPKAFVGSAACQECHQEIYDRWKGTLMANILQDVKERPEAILGDFSKPDPLVTFTRDDITYTYGSKWKQRYFKRVDDDFIVMPAQWDVQNKQWHPYYVKPGTEWWPRSIRPNRRSGRPERFAMDVTR